MSITWRHSDWSDIEQGLAIQTKNRGDSIVDPRAAMDAWEYISRTPFFSSVVLESKPPIQGHTVVGFGACVLVSRRFADDELQALRPGLNSRMIATIPTKEPAVATREEVARAHAQDGVDLLILCPSCWRSDILSPSQCREADFLLTSSFAKCVAGYRLRRILCETVDEVSAACLRSSGVFQQLALYPELGRAQFLLTRQSAEAVSGSMANILFSYREPVMRFRESDQELLLAALDGDTDQELAAKLKLSPSAIKARWRSAFARIAAVMPGMVDDMDTREGRGMQKRHRVLAYIRSHPEELRPFEWKPASSSSRS